jgi:hypothetical protein
MFSLLKNIMRKLIDPFISKKHFKKRNKVCRICGEDRYELLDTHRLKEQGPYSVSNCVCICNSCHRKHHSNLIKIIEWCHSTKGTLLHYIDEEGNEQFI